MATVYSRIANPYQGAPSGNAGGLNAPTPFYAPGEIGGAYNDQSTGRAYARVKLDSGATSATPVGVVASGQLAFWKDRSANLVTNDKRMADVGSSGSINRVAGVFQTAVTAAPGINGSDGQALLYVCDICIQGKAVPCVSADNSGVIGGVALASTSTSSAGVVGAAAVTTAPISQVIGVNVTAPAASTVNVDVSIGFIA